MDYRSPLQDAYGHPHGSQSYYGQRHEPYYRRDFSYRQIPQHPGFHGPRPRFPPHQTMDRPTYNNRYKPTSYPRELTEQFGAQECGLCAVELLSPIVGKMHYSGKQHLKKVKLYLLEWSARTGLPMPDMGEKQPTESTLADYCDVCDVKLPSINDKILHYAGKTHKKNELNPANAKKKKKKGYETVDLKGRFGIRDCFVLEDPDKEKEAENDDLNDEFVCKLCDVHAVSADQLNQHLIGKKHKEKLEKKNAQFPKEGRPFPCMICNVSLETSAQLQLHIDGKRHKKAIAKLELNDLKQDIEDSGMCKYCPFVGNLKDHICEKSLTNVGFNDLENKWVCTYCNSMVFDNEEEFNDHKLSSKHVLCVLNNEEGDKMLEELEHWYCILCKKQFHNNKEYTDHLFQDKHLKLSQEQAIVESSNNLYICGACNLTMTHDVKEKHLLDRQHIKTTLLKTITKFVSDLANKDLGTRTYQCDNCKVGPFSFLQFGDHILGASHIEFLIDESLKRIAKRPKPK